MFVCCCRFLEKRRKGTNLGLSQEFDNNPESPLWGKRLLMHHSTLGVPMSGILRIELMPSASREVFPIRVTRRLYRTLREDGGGFFFSLI
jgi:hypothetical protein